MEESEMNVKIKPMIAMEYKGKKKSLR